MSDVACSRKWLTESFNQAPGKTGSCCNANLLSENGADCQLESIPAAGHAQSGSGIDQRGHLAIRLEGAGDVGPICVQIEHGADAFDDEKEGSRIAELNLYRERVVVRVE